jgi:hypothetical protein
MPGNNNAPLGVGGVNQTLAGSGMLASPSLTNATDITYVVIVVSPYGNPRWRVYLSLQHASAAVRRSQKKGQPAELILCRLEPVAADLNIDGGELP